MDYLTYQTCFNWLVLILPIRLLIKPVMIIPIKHSIIPIGLLITYLRILPYLVLPSCLACLACLKLNLGNSDRSSFEAFKDLIVNFIELISFEDYYQIIILKMGLCWSYYSSFLDYSAHSASYFKPEDLTSFITCFQGPFLQDLPFLPFITFQYFQNFQMDFIPFQFTYY